MTKKRGCPSGTKKEKGLCLPKGYKDLKKIMMFKNQRISAPKGYVQWSTYPVSDKEIMVVWGKMKND